MNRLRITRTTKGKKVTTKKTRYLASNIDEKLTKIDRITSPKMTKK